MIESLQLRIHGEAGRPTLIYLPGLHGDWTLVSSFREAIKPHCRFVECTYPRTLSWTMNDYGQALRSALLEKGIDHGWILGESFGSQVAWALAALANNQGQKRPANPATTSVPADFRIDGLILPGGFVRHPFPRLVHAFHALHARVPLGGIRSFLYIYLAYARLRHRHAPETLASMEEFKARRTPEDIQAITHRLRLIAENDPRDIARHFQAPVFLLAGLVDPVVPCPLVRRWLRRFCPAFQGCHTIWSADHNVLATSPAKAARQVWTWMRITGKVTYN
jgi:pimeloyl-ACP methyl ester carboxylesterase